MTVSRTFRDVRWVLLLGAIAPACAPAAAQPARRTAPPASAAPPAAPVSLGEPLVLQIDMSYGGDRRTYRLRVNRGDCAELVGRGLERSDEVRICDHSRTPERIAIGTKWKISAGAVTYSAAWVADVVRGGHVETGPIGDAWFTLHVR